MAEVDPRPITGEHFEAASKINGLDHMHAYGPFALDEGYWGYRGAFQPEQRVSILDEIAEIPKGRFRLGVVISLDSGLEVDSLETGVWELWRGGLPI